MKKLLLLFLMAFSFNSFSLESTLSDEQKQKIEAWVQNLNLDPKQMHIMKDVIDVSSALIKFCFYVLSMDNLITNNLEVREFLTSKITREHLKQFSTDLELNSYCNDLETLPIEQQKIKIEHLFKIAQECINSLERKIQEKK